MSLATASGGDVFKDNPESLAPGLFRQLVNEHKEMKEAGRLRTSENQQALEERPHETNVENRNFRG